MLKKRLIRRIYNMLLDAEEYSFFEIRDLCEITLPSLSLLDVMRTYKNIKSR
jgi:hypothetical protein